MNDEDIDIDDESLDDLEDESLTIHKCTVDADSRRRLEERLEQVRLRRLTQDFDFD